MLYPDSKRSLRWIGNAVPRCAGTVCRASLRRRVRSTSRTCSCPARRICTNARRGERPSDDDGPSAMARCRRIEHRSVAFDTALHLGAGWSQHAVVMSIVTPLLRLVEVGGTRYPMEADRAASNFSFVDFRDAGKRGRLPTSKAILSQIPRYVRPGFHPSETGSLESAQAYLARSKGNRGKTES